MTGILMGGGINRERQRKTNRERQTEQDRQRRTNRERQTERDRQEKTNREV